ncbi:MAG: ATP-binding cassette domain-containing protein [Candidatus Zixiibacteriota bacterium]
MIEFRNVDFSYDTKPILKNVSFTVGQSEAVVIMGPSGSGKSTVLRLILGLECPQHGEILVDGQNICLMKEKQKQEIRKKIGMVFQDGALFDSLSVWENVGYYLLEHTTLPVDEIGQRAMEMLGFVGLDAEEIMNKLPEHLSGGMQRRVAIGRALLSTDPRVMLYDEPTTGLDPQSTENVIALINKLHDEKSLSTVVVTHQIADALAIADKFVVIVNGEVVFIGTLDQLRLSDNEKVRAFLEPFRQSVMQVAERKFVDI